MFQNLGIEQKSNIYIVTFFKIKKYKKMINII